MWLTSDKLPEHFFAFSLLVWFAARVASHCTPSFLSSSTKTSSRQRTAGKALFTIQGGFAGVRMGGMLFKR
ncbi:hypothetical protein BKA70DRAFT_1333678 [Coprinopsis sp. MPI-PUGE-AT-0042]|nr:hypothetical protein BKA70DRAFT_1333678 [Coprinopsis sp. MPI-PUGE-AT-0042]